MTVAVGLVTAASDCTDEERYRQDLIRFMRLLGTRVPGRRVRQAVYPLAE